MDRTNRPANQPTNKTMRKYSLALLLAAACAGCAHHRASTHTVALAPNEGQVEELNEASPATTSLSTIVPQFSSRAATPILISQRPAYSMDQALFSVQRVSKQPILAMAQYRNWFFYATDVTRDPNTQAIQDLRGGYAVQRGGYLAWRW